MFGGGMQALHLAASRASWERYQADDPALVRADDALAPLIEAWDRARAAGAPVDGPAPGDYVLERAAASLHREAIEPLLVDGADVIERATHAFAQRDHVLLVTDAHGVVSQAAGGGRFADEARRLRLIEGAAWSEPARGTNAIGTAIALDRPTIVHGPAHFGRRFHDLVCYAAPIHGPDGAVIAVLDATSHAGAADPSLAGIVAAAALALEGMLRARSWSAVGAAARQLVERTLDRVATPGLFVERPGRIVRCNAAARAWLGPPPMPRDVEAALGVTWATLEREARAPTAGGLAVGGRKSTRLRVEPLLGADGAVIALAVFADVSTAAPVPRIARPSPDRPDAFARVFAEDPGTAAAVAFARKIAASDLPVVLLSETGSGKELFAEAMHAASPRAAGPFVAVNCGSIAPNLLEAELFGHGPGAFTGGAVKGREGLFHAAHGGTLFLDEVAEMPAPMQTALLRVLESGQYVRVGETSVRRADVRVICATCRDLVGMVAQGGFRRDLYYRLKSVIVTLPPLRDRTDKLALARRLLGPDAPPLSAALAAWIEAYPWPGNVRELKAVLAVVKLLGADADALDVVHLPPDLAEPAPPMAPVADAPASLADMERWAIERTMAELGGNVSAVARKLGVARSTLYRMLQR